MDKIKLSKKVFFKKIKDRYIIIKEGEKYIRQLNETGSLIWELIIRKKRVKDIIKKLVDIYEINIKQAETDVFLFIKKYLEEGILEEEK